MMRLNLIKNCSQILIVLVCAIFINHAYALNITSTKVPSEGINALASFNNKFYAAGNTVYQFNDDANNPVWSPVGSGLSPAGTQFS